MDAPRQPRAMAHVGVTVPDVDRAVEWYRDVLGFSVIQEPSEVVAHEGHAGQQAYELLGEFDLFRVAHLSTADHIGFEIFEFENTEGDTETEIGEPGFFHICVIDPDIEGLAALIDESGGEHHTPIWDMYPGQEYRITYCKDPFGNLIELHTHSHERIYSNQD